MYSTSAFQMTAEGLISIPKTPLWLVTLAKTQASGQGGLASVATVAILLE